MMVLGSSVHTHQKVSGPLRPTPNFLFIKKKISGKYQCVPLVIIQGKHNDSLTPTLQTKDVVTTVKGSIW